VTFLFTRCTGISLKHFTSIRWKLSEAIARKCLSDNTDALGIDSMKYIPLPRGLPSKDLDIVWATAQQKGVALVAPSFGKAKDRAMPAMKLKRRMSLSERAIAAEIKPYRRGLPDVWSSK
jgi:hypothetical protein